MSGNIIAGQLRGTASGSNRSQHREQFGRVHALCQLVRTLASIGPEASARGVFWVVCTAPQGVPRCLTRHWHCHCAVRSTCAAPDGMEGSHTILLVQFRSLDPLDKQMQVSDARMYSEYEDTDIAMNALRVMFEKYLKAVHPEARRIEYGLDDLWRYIDSFIDVSCLVLDPRCGMYIPHDREWIKTEIRQHLRRMQDR